jgi:glc operon protein GlcG
MKTKPMLCLDEARKAIEASRLEASANGWEVTIAVVDDGGHLLMLERLDGCAPIGAYIAVEKARTAAMGRRESKKYEETINNGRVAFLSAPHIAGLLEGGVPIVIDGHVVGAVGISGVRPEQDSQIAAAGVQSLLPR